MQIVLVSSLIKDNWFSYLLLRSIYWISFNRNVWRKSSLTQICREEYFNRLQRWLWVFFNTTPKFDKQNFIKSWLQCGIWNHLLGHLENIGSLNDAVLTITIYIIFKNCIHWYRHNFIRQVFKYWKIVKLTLVDTEFPKSNFSLESLNFIVSHKYYQVVSLKWQAYFIHCWENIFQRPKSG